MKSKVNKGDTATAVTKNRNEWSTLELFIFHLIFPNDDFARRLFVDDFCSALLSVSLHFIFSFIFGDKVSHYIDPYENLKPYSLYNMYYGVRLRIIYLLSGISPLVCPCHCHSDKHRTWERQQNEFHWFDWVFGAYFPSHRTKMVHQMLIEIVLQIEKAKHAKRVQFLWTHEHDNFFFFFKFGHSKPERKKNTDKLQKSDSTIVQQDCFCICTMVIGWFWIDSHDPYVPKHYFLCCL